VLEDGFGPDREDSRGCRPDFECLEVESGSPFPFMPGWASMFSYTNPASCTTDRNSSSVLGSPPLWENTILTISLGMTRTIWSQKLIPDQRTVVFELLYLSKVLDNISLVLEGSELISLTIGFRRVLKASRTKCREHQYR